MSNSYNSYGLPILVTDFVFKTKGNFNKPLWIGNCP